MYDIVFEKLNTARQIQQFLTGPAGVDRPLYSTSMVFTANRRLMCNVTADQITFLRAAGRMLRKRNVVKRRRYTVSGPNYLW